MQTALYFNQKRFIERDFSKEKDLEDLMFANAKSIFGQNSILIETKKRIDNKALGGTIPDAFLFDLKNPQNPEFYLVEVELAKHSFYDHIFKQITKFFAFFKNPESQGQLITKLYDVIRADKELLKEFKAKIGNEEIYKFIKDTVENSQNILLILDKDMPELPEIVKTYTDTWGKIVKLTLLKEYCNNTESIISLTPEFENLESVDIISDEDNTNPYTENYHLEGVSPEIKEVYTILQKELYEQIKELKYNPQRYYISLRKKRNFAFLDIRKKKMSLVAMLEQSQIEARIKHHQVSALAESVQKFYNGPCAEILITDKEHIDEVINLLVEIQK
jgi:predicted transport protein